MQLDLEEQEASLLYRIARNRLRELRVEVRHNRNSEARDYLRHKERLLNRILEKFSEVDESAHMAGFKPAAAKKTA